MQQNFGRVSPPRPLSHQTYVPSRLAYSRRKEQILEHSKTTRNVVCIPRRRGLSPMARGCGNNPDISHLNTYCMNESRTSKQTVPM